MPTRRLSTLKGFGAAETMGKAAREKKGGATRRTPLDEDIARDQEDQKRKEVRPMARKKLREESKHKREQKLQDEEVRFQGILPSHSLQFSKDMHNTPRHTGLLRSTRTSVVLEPPEKKKEDNYVLFFICIIYISKETFSCQVVPL